MNNVPKVDVRAQVEMKFSMTGSQDFGHLCKRFEFKAMVNGGYIARGQLIDPSFNMLRTLIDAGYLAQSRKQKLEMSFTIKAAPDGQFPKKATRQQKVIIISMSASGQDSDKGVLEFIGIDPPSWYLNTGDGSGKVYVGNVKKVIQEVVKQYAPSVNLSISNTVDSKENKWWMMRQDPKTFISSLIDWSSSITQNRTNWLVAMNDHELHIKEQADMRSRQRAYYRFMDDRANDTISSWKILSNNALSITETKIITQGLSAISGRYFDRITDIYEEIVFAKDMTTAKKQVARVANDESFSKPNDAPGSGPTEVGWTSVQSVPEIYSAGDAGLRLDEYIDGRARGMFLNLVPGLFRMKLTVIGHGEWSDCIGLGVDTIYLKWTSDNTRGKSLYFLSGNWLVYGFQHVFKLGSWYTDLYISRFDHNSNAKKVGKS